MASRAIELASLEIFALRVLPDSSLFRSHLRMFRRSGSKQDGGSPSDLRAVSALAAFGERTRARQILQLVTDRALASHALILGDSTGTGCPVSAKAPTIGMGAGAYLLALSDLAD
jgi:hypothetical protein